MKRFFYILICLFPLVGCNTSKVTVKVDGTVITLNADSTKTHNVNISVGQLASFTKTMKGGEEFNIMDSLKLNESAHYELAYALAQNNGLMDVHLSIPSTVDTEIQCQFKYNEMWEHKGEITSGKFAKIVNTFDSENIDTELRRWVYKNKKTNIGDTLFNTMRLYLRELSVEANSRYIVKGNIPSFQSSNLENTYKVSSDMIADNYFLFAGNDDSDLDYFIEEMIADNLSYAEKSLESPLKCSYLRNPWGTQCIFLVGINNDWSSQVVPLGTISIDDVAPSYGMHRNPYNEAYVTLQFPKRGFTIEVPNHPKVSGNWDVNVGSFEGLNPYDVPFTLTWSGDVSKIVIYRSKNSPYTINLSGKTSPYHMTLSTNLPNTGDNYVKLEAYDKLGNKASADLNIELVRVKDNAPQIDIDNNIWN